MKLLSFSLAGKKNSRKFSEFFLVPYLSVRSLRYHPPRDRKVFERLLLFFSLTLLWVVSARIFFQKLSLWQIWLFSPAIYFFTEAVGALGQMLFSKHPTFRIHRTPLLASGLSHFWGRDWNLWVQDWLRDVSENVARRKSYRVVIVFVISGLFHEVMVNLPYWLYFQRSYFGTMIAYFLVQALLLAIDKRFIRHRSLVYRRIYLWLSVVIPSPFFINVPLLTFFGLLP